LICFTNQLKGSLKNSISLAGFKTLYQCIRFTHHLFVNVFVVLQIYCFSGLFIDLAGRYCLKNNELYSFPVPFLWPISCYTLNTFFSLSAKKEWNYR